MRVEEVDEVQLQAAGSSGTGMSFMHTSWGHPVDAGSVRVRVHLMRWLNGSFVGKQENAVRMRCSCCAVSAHEMTLTAAQYYNCNSSKCASDSQNCSL